MNHRELFRAEGLPVLQNKTFATRSEALASDRGVVCLVEDGQTGLVHNCEFDSNKLRYDANYQNEQSCSQSFQRHLGEVASIIDRHFDRQRLIEVGCGKGYFLEELRRRGYEATGIDPAYEGDSPHILKASFGPGLGLSGDAIVLRHVLEHIVHPLGFLADLLKANDNRGLIYIEVPCFDWICQHRSWFDVYYEHVNYFRLTDFDRMFGSVLESGRLFGGQYLYVVADLSTLHAPRLDAADRVSFPSDFAQGRDRYRSLPTGSRAIWGAASKGVIFAIHMQRLGTAIDLAIDINPAKQGRYLPCSGLRVVSPDEAMRAMPVGSEIFVMNSNYLTEIRALSGDRHNCVPIDHV